jgi:Ca2+:H+ antiporter
MRLATEIAVSSSAQVGLLVVPVVVLASLAFAHPVPRSFRWEELAAMGGATAFVAVLLADGRTRRWEGYVLAAVYAATAVGFLLAGDR